MTGWGAALISHRYFIQIQISLLFAIKINLLESCFCDGLEAYSTAEDFVTGLFWLLQPLTAGTLSLAPHLCPGTLVLPGG